MMVFTAEMIGMMRGFTRGIALDAETLALEVIHGVGPGGDFLAADHTLSHFRDFWQPSLFERLRADEWKAGGAQRLGDRLRDRTISILDEHQPEALPDGVREEIGYILKEGVRT
jgi:trimethylamine--corrinoid protein Co-methyltransferase